MPIPAPEVIASSVIAAGTASVASVVLWYCYAVISTGFYQDKTFKKIFTKDSYKKEVANL